MTDTSEQGLEALIVAALVGPAPEPSGAAHDSARSYGAGYVLGQSQDYDAEHALDLAKLWAFLKATQPAVMQQLGLTAAGPKRQRFLGRLQGEIEKRGVVEVLREGIKDGPAHVDLYYASPSRNNPRAVERADQNLFSVTRQLRYSRDQSRRALDLCLFINGLPIATFELKNSLTGQTWRDAVEQYQRDRDPRELLFHFGRCLVHFAVDDQQVHFCTHLTGKDSWFLPFNQGFQDGAGNPTNPRGLKTDYLWRQILTRGGLTDILENYAQIIEETDERSGRKRRTQIFPRYHQLDVVRRLLASARQHGAGQRYLIQHSAGSGKSNSIAWLAHQLVGVESGGAPVFASVIVVTDRKVLDRQIRDTIRRFAQVAATLGHAEHSGDLRRFLASGKKIIITTVQKFPVVLKEIGDEHRGNRFAILIDEAHSSQGGNTATKMNLALAAKGAPAADDEDGSIEDQVNRLMEGRKMLDNASYFAFTATPKNKTLELFGDLVTESDEVRHRPCHSYTMKQAIEERFILDVLRSYTPVASYYRLTKRVEDDPEFDGHKAQRKLRRYVESHEDAIREKAEIMVDHFHEQVLARQKIGGQARAMVVTGGIEHAIKYLHAFRAYLQERKSPWQAIVAFSGEHEYGGRSVTEDSLNCFPNREIPTRIRQDPYRFLICADKFQTGYDEPLLHTMYVDKPLSGVKAVQTLSRLNRAHPQKHDTFVLDFQNDADGIQRAFEPYYRTTLLSGETDPNRLHDLQADLDRAQVYEQAQVESLVGLYLGGAARDRLDPILDVCAALYRDTLDEDGQVRFKGQAKAFVRAYGFLAAILPYSHAGWEKLFLFLNLLLPKLPAPREEDLSKGILDTIDMESYRVEVRAATAIRLADQDAEIAPVPLVGGGKPAEQALTRLSEILRQFNDLFGNIPWQDADKIGRTIAEEIPAKVAADKTYQNAIKNSDRQNARIEHDSALRRVLSALLKDHTELYKQFMDNPDFRRWLSDTDFAATYAPPQPDQP